MPQPQTSSSIGPMADSIREQVRRQCDNCQRRKDKCDGLEPCSRCLGDSLTCAYNTWRRRRATVFELTQEVTAPDVAQGGPPSKLRYHVVLNAPTALLQHHGQVSVTYLDSGQIYSISVTDQAPSPIPVSGLFYRSHVRISFDNEQQGRQHATCWHLRNERSGFRETFQPNGRPQAVEFANMGTEGGRSSNAHVELESVSHDGFSVLWYPSATGPKQCSFHLKFHFLSSDFNPFENAKGLPVRLCVKTKMKLPDALGDKRREQGHLLASETCYCNVKLSRDHGAERKLSNDVTHVKKCIDEFKTSIADIKSPDSQQRPCKHKRDDRNSSPVSPTQGGVVVVAKTGARSTASGQKFSGETLGDAEALDDLKTKLMALHDLFVPTKPISVLDLKCEDLEDSNPDSVEIAQKDTKEVGEAYQASSRGRKREQTPISLHSQTSQSSSPPRASSVGTNGGHSTPDRIPFQNVQFDDHQDEIYQPSTFAYEQSGTMTPDLPNNEYHYTAIQPEEVRLMVLYPGRFDDMVFCGLKIMPLSRLKGSQFVYQALSYAWGPKTDLKEIWIEDVPASREDSDAAAVSRTFNTDIGSRKFYIRPNLYAALRRLRPESGELWFWIDAICIDQENLVEKGDQVPKMLDIYCNAWSVCIWLGEAELPSSVGLSEPFDLIGTIINLKLLDCIVEAPAIDEDMMLSLIAFGKLLKRPWFRGRWVIQEVSSSTRASVQYGGHSVNWIDFADAVQLFVLKLDRIRALYRGSRLFERDPAAFSHVEAAGASAIVQATNDVLRKGEDGRIVARRCDIETLVMRFVHFEASDPRDTIFALWSLANIWNTAEKESPILSQQVTISPSSYMRPCESIYVDFVCHCSEQQGSLDIICRHWALPLDGCPQSEQPPRLQSWIGTTANSPFGMHLGSGGRINGDSLVGAPDRKVFNSSNNSSPTVSTLPSFEFNTILRVSGRALSRVSQASPRIVDGIIPYDALRLLGWTDRSTVDNIPDRLWRTLVADRTSDGSKAPSWWRRASMFALSMASRDGDLSTQRLLQNNSLPQMAHEYLRRVQAMVWNRRIFALESSAVNGVDATSSISTLETAGLGPRDARQGDYLCVLYGCSVLVLLREVPDAGRDGLFELVGECYVHGMMDGEALFLGPDSHFPTTFDLYDAHSSPSQG